MTMSIYDYNTKIRMKTVLLIALLATVCLSSEKKKHRKHRKHHTRMHSHSRMKNEKDVVTYNTATTKKFIKSDGSSLRNHFGYPWDESPYAGGP